MKDQEAVETAKVVAIKRDINLAPERMKLAEYERNDWVVTAEQGTTQDDIVNTAYFAHMAMNMKPYDRVEVRIDDGSWIADMVVLQVERNWVRTKILAYHELADSTATGAGPSAYTVEFKGPHLKWCIIRKSDQERIKTGFSDRAAGEAAKADLERLSA